MLPPWPYPLPVSLLNLFSNHILPHSLFWLKFCFRFISRLSFLWRWFFLLVLDASDLLPNLACVANTGIRSSSLSHVSTSYYDVSSSSLVWISNVNHDMLRSFTFSVQYNNNRILSMDEGSSIMGRSTSWTLGVS